MNLTIPYQSTPNSLLLHVQPEWWNCATGRQRSGLISRGFRMFEDMEDANLRELLSWLMAIVIALAFITTGWPMIFGSEEVESEFIQWGYTIDFAHLVGILQIIAGILVLIPRLSIFGALMAILIMSGAVYTHFSTSIGSPGFAVVLLLLAIILLILRWKQNIFYARLKREARNQ